MHTRIAVHGVLALLGCAAVVHAQHAGDVLLRTNAGQVQTGSADGTSVTFPEQVFTASFGDLGLPDRTTNPGFNSIPNEYPLNTLVQMQLRRAARKWDPAAGNFCVVPPEFIEVRRGTNSANWIRTPAVDPAAPGFLGPTANIGTTDSTDGLIHQHPTYWLFGPGGFGGTPPSDGVYLLEAQVLTAPLMVSAPFWVVFNQNASPADLSNAMAYAEETLEHGSGNLCRCRADFDDDEAVTVVDLFDYLDAWFAQSGQMVAGLSADFDRSGDVGVVDLFAFLDRWFAQC